jgi:hypothetical protein
MAIIMILSGKRQGLSDEIRHRIQELIAVYVTDVAE